MSAAHRAQPLVPIRQVAPRSALCKRKVLIIVSVDEESVNDRQVGSKEGGVTIMDFRWIDMIAVAPCDTQGHAEPDALQIRILY